MASVADNAAACLHEFRVLLTSTDGADTGDAELLLGLSPDLVKDQLARFKVWSANIGAHRKGRSSLDYRLRDASHIRAQAIQLLEDLSRSLQDASSICQGETTPWDREPCEESALEHMDDASPGLGTELAQISADISEVLDCLFRLSVSIRNPAPHDRFKKSNLTNTSHHEPFDISHAREMFPLAETALIERLGKALSRRRQYFLYREMRHQKFSRGLEDDDADMVEESGPSTIASSIPGHMKQTTTTWDSTQQPVLEEGRMSEAGWTDTTRGSSLAEGDRPRIPPLPADAHERPFECPFCYMIVSATTTAAWTKHVLADLQPYICLEPECTIPDEQFQGRREWVRHVVQKHWSFWTCAMPGCRKYFSSATQITCHIQEQHQDSLNQVPVETLVDMSERRRPLDTASECPLCHEQLASMKDYARHVGRHQKDLALFALPRLDVDNEDNQDRVEEEGKPDSESSDTEEELLDLELPLSPVLGTSNTNEASYPEVEAMKKQLAEYEAAKKKREEEERLAELREGMRKEAEEALDRRMEAMRQAQEEAKEEIEQARLEAEKAARERLETEKKQEGERRKAQEEALKRIEREAREKLAAEIRANEERKRRETEAAALAEAQAKARIELAIREEQERIHARIKVEEEAKAAAEAKATQEAERMKRLEEDAKKALEAAIKEQEEKLAAAVKVEREKIEAAQKAEAEATAAAAKKAAEDDEFEVQPGQDTSPDPTTPLAPGTFRCDVCGGVFDQADRLEHKRYHDKPFPCTVPGCTNRSFGTITHLRRHINDQHTASRKFYCTQTGCPYSRAGGKAFPRKDNWKRHMIIKHGIMPDEDEDAQPGMDGITLTE